MQSRVSLNRIFGDYCAHQFCNHFFGSVAPETPRVNNTVLKATVSQQIGSGWYEYGYGMADRDVVDVECTEGIQLRIVRVTHTDGELTDSRHVHALVYELLQVDRPFRIGYYLCCTWIIVVFCRSCTSAVGYSHIHRLRSVVEYPDILVRPLLTNRAGDDDVGEFSLARLSNIIAGQGQTYIHI